MKVWTGIGAICLAAVFGSPSAFAQDGPTASDRNPAAQGETADRQDGQGVAPDGEDAAPTPAGGQELSEDPEAGLKLREKYSELPRVELEAGFYYQDIHEGTGEMPEEGAVVYIMARGYDANGGAIDLGDDNHSHPSDADTNHEHPPAKYQARWFVFGYGGGNLSLGTDGMNRRFATALSTMRENGKRLIYISAENAYGEQGYQGHSFKVEPNTDLLLEVSMIRVRMVKLPEEVHLH